MVRLPMLLPGHGGGGEDMAVVVVVVVRIIKGMPPTREWNAWPTKYLHFLHNFGTHTHTHSLESEKRKNLVFYILHFIKKYNNLLIT